MPARQFSKTFYGQCWKDLSTVFGDYCITEIGKLHNLYVEGNNRNLSIDYVVSRDFWSKEEKDKIHDLVSSMKDFFEKIKPAYDNLLTRNDFNTYLDETLTVLGKFETGEDEEYFQELAELCNLVWGKLVEKNLVEYKQFEFSNFESKDDSSQPSLQAQVLRKLIIDGLITNP